MVAFTRPDDCINIAIRHVAGPLGRGPYSSPYPSRLLSPDALGMDDWIASTDDWEYSGDDAVLTLRYPPPDVAFIIAEEEAFVSRQVEIDMASMFSVPRNLLSHRTRRPTAKTREKRRFRDRARLKRQKLEKQKTKQPRKHRHRLRKAYFRSKR